MRLPKQKVLAAGAALAAGLPILLFADVTGADPRLTGAPGDEQRACTACHTGTALNGGPGSVKIVLPGGNTYAPGVTQRVQVQVSDPAQRRWGFELTARPASNPTGGRAGTLTPTDSNTRVECETRTCSATSVQFITHTQNGTRNGTTGGVTFEFDWTPPATDAGTVVLYAAGNAANGNNQDSGDRIYTTKLEVTPAAAAADKPAISSDRGVVNGASFRNGIAPGAYVTIRGTNLASASRLWASSDFQNGKLPASLDGVSVTVNNKPAFVEYISPTQLNVIAPADTATGPVEVKVTNNGVASDPMVVDLQSLAPAFFAFDGRYLAATHADGSLAGKAGLFPAAPAATTPVKPGETVILYGTGFGRTNPEIAADVQTDQLAPLVAPVNITIGGQPATVTFAGLVPPFAHLYQFNVVVPASVPAGDQAVVAETEGATSVSGADCCFLTIQP